jgi:hypothetical protein
MSHHERHGGVIEARFCLFSPALRWSRGVGDTPGSCQHVVANVQPSASIPLLSVVTAFGTPMRAKSWSRLAGCLAALVLLPPSRGFHVPSSNDQPLTDAMPVLRTVPY